MSRPVMRVVVVNVVVFCVLAEIAGLVVYYAQAGELFYLHRPNYALIPETAQGEITADRLNPYFGPSHKAGQPFDFPTELREAGRPVPRQLTTNNFGFDSPYQCPIVKGNREFIVGLFGGSVGVFFCLAGADRLVADLQQHEFFKDRTIVPLCMAHEGYKQPQQLLVLAYFLSIGQTFDLVISDYEMPETTGLALAKEVHQVRSDTPVILCSGRYKTNARVGADDANVRRLITKPYSAAVLGRIIREVLDESPRA